MPQATTSGAAASPDNPLLAEWHTPFAMPPFEAIVPAHFEPAFTATLASHEREIDDIAGSAEPPTFANTIEALEIAGRKLTRVARGFYNLTGRHTNPELQSIELEMAPRMARHSTAIALNEALFRRVDALWKTRDQLGLDDEQMRVLERTHTSFLRSGANLGPEAKERI